MSNRKTILVVEDEGVVARQLQLSLSDLGYCVPSTAASAEEALRFAEEQRPDLVLMDVHIEGEMDGIDVASNLRALFDVPIVYLTAYADAATVERAKVTEPYGYLTKPVDANKLGSVVEVALYKHEMDRKLRLSEAKLAGIVSLSADAIVSIDEGQRITLFNEGAEKIFGYSMAEAIGKPLDILLPERFRAVHRRHVAGFATEPVAARRMGEREVTIFGRRKSGEEFPAEAAISRIEVGGVRVFTVTLRDISERRRIEEEQRFLAEAGAVLAGSIDDEQTLTNIARLSVRFADWCVVDLVEDDGRISRSRVVAADPAKQELAEALRRYPIDRARPHLAVPALSTGTSVLAPDVPSGMLESLAQDECYRELLRAVQPCSYMALPLRARGRLLGSLLLVSAESGRRYERRDLRFAEDLAGRAALAIDNARLYRTEQRAVRARDLVLGVVAHDLRNLLGPVVMGAKLLSGEREERRRKTIEVIRRSAEKMNRLIDDLLDTARIDEGKLSIERAPQPVAPLVSEVVEVARAVAGSRDLCVDLPDDLPGVDVDRDRILQVFSNLMGNAVKFTPQEGRITVSAEAKERELWFCVADTGPGISEADAPHIFDRFWQAARRDRGGVGLGLSICSGIVEAHGGRIWVESLPGAGSRFYFSVPLSPSRPMETAS